MQQEFTVTVTVTTTGINPLWAADTACIPTWAGFACLAVMLDGYAAKFWAERSASSKRQIS